MNVEIHQNHSLYAQTTTTNTLQCYYVKLLLFTRSEEEKLFIIPRWDWNKYNGVIRFAQNVWLEFEISRREEVEVIFIAAAFKTRNNKR